MSKYEELKERIEALENGWDKEADDLLKEIIGKERCVIEFHNNNRVIEVGYYRDFLGGTFKYTSQCEKMSAFRNILLYLLDHSDIKKNLVGREVKAEIEGKIYQVKVLSKE